MPISICIQRSLHIYTFAEPLRSTPSYECRRLPCIPANLVKHDAIQKEKSDSMCQHRQARHSTSSGAVQVYLLYEVVGRNWVLDAIALNVAVYERFINCTTILAF